MTVVKCSGIIGQTRMSSLNQKLFDIIHGWSGIDPNFDKVILFCAVHLWWVLVVAIVAFYIFFKRNTRGLAELFVIGSSGAVSYVVAFIVKHVTASPRPIEVLKNPLVLLHDVASSAFPSGHSAFVFGIAVALLLYDWLLGVVALVLALLVGVARVAAGVHWPIDILGGILVGAIIAIIIHAVASIFFRDRITPPR